MPLFDSSIMTLIHGQVFVSLMEVCTWWPQWKMAVIRLKKACWKKQAHVYQEEGGRKKKRNENNIIIIKKK